MNEHREVKRKIANIFRLVFAIAIPSAVLAIFPAPLTAIFILPLSRLSSLNLDAILSLPPTFPNTVPLKIPALAHNSLSFKSFEYYDSL